MAYYSPQQYPRAPPSPPMEDNKCSLPSISNLLDLADAVSESHTPRSSPRPQDSPLWRRRDTPSHDRNSSQSQKVFPPTPPMIVEASFDHHSPTSHPHDSPRSHQYQNRTPPVEDAQYQPYARQAAPAPGALAPASQPGQASQGQGYPAASRQEYHPSPLQQQYMPTQQQQQNESTAVWHHHYLHPSQNSNYAPTQDRYICPTCHKAFSRPSSLRIHSHSHTGEKPFKCPHPGCGKAFSVRSNMKRHERGCHTYETHGNRPLYPAMN